jgi:drug/metabolite transporter (DMT)-like permease
VSETKLAFAPILAVIAGELCFAIMGALIKYMSLDLTSEMLVFFRNSLAFLIIVPLLYRQGGIQAFKTEQLRFHALRGLIGVTAMSCFFYILGRMHFTEAILLKLCTPFFIPLVALFWLKESSSKSTIFAICIGFIGVLIITEPKLNEVGESGFGDIYLVLIGLAGACLAAVAKVTIRRMGTNEPSLRIVFYFSVFASLASLPFALNNWTSPSGAQLAMLFALASVATIGQLLVTYAYKQAKAGQIGQYTYTSLIFSSLMGWFFWQEALTLSIILGSLCIVGAGIINLRAR